MGTGWIDIVSALERITYRVHAGNALGTAFALGMSQGDGGRHTLFGTAWHVAEHACSAAATLDLFNAQGLSVAASTTGPAAIYPIGPRECDSAAIALPTNEPLHQPNELLSIHPTEFMLPPGAEIGWVGYPGMVHPQLCFFRGVVSGYLHDPPVYLVDGVALGGVSGGPAVDDRGQLVGLVSAYLPNEVAPGRTLPGLLVLTPINLIRMWVQDVLAARVIERRH